MRSFRRSAALLGILTVVVSGVFGGLALGQESPSTSPSEASQEKVTFTWGSTGEPSSLNPMSGYLALDFYFWTSSYHLLIDFDENLAAEDGLATDVETSADSMTFTYTIRDDIVWSDGVPLTANDVAFTLNLYKQNHAYLPQNYLTLIDGDVQATDATHITFTTIAPTGLYTGAVPYMYDYILPEHIFKDIEQPKTFENVPSVGSGPFFISEYQVGEFVKMERNTHWTGPEPKVDELVYRIFKNEDALATALTEGEVDFAYFSSANIFNSLEGQENISTLAGTIPSFSEIGMNTGSAYQEADDLFTPHGDGHPALTDLTVRRAIRMAISSEELTDKVLLGYGLPGTTIIPPVSVAGARWEPTGADLIQWDIPGANQLLDDAGYADTDGDGVREMPADSADAGKPLEFRYYVRTNEQTSVDAAPFVRAWLGQIGVEADVQAVTSNRLGDIINEGTYDLFSWGWIPDPDPDSALSWFTCDQRPPDGKTYGNNDSYYCNPQYDALYDEQRTTLDPEARWEIVHEMQKMFYEDAPYAIMWYDPVFQAYRTDRFTGYNAQPAPEGDLLEGYGGPSKVWTTLELAGEASGRTSSSATRGLPVGVWIGVVVGVLAIIGAIVLVRRSRSDEDRA